MDGLSATPIVYSGLEEDEFNDLSADEEGEDEESDDEDEEDGAEQAEEILGLKERYVQPRFTKWLEKQPPKGDRELLDALWERLDVLKYDLELTSSARLLSVSFEIARMRAHYEQRSEADPCVDIWDADTLALLPNVEASLRLDDELLLSCKYFAGPAPAAAQKVPPALQTSAPEVSESSVQEGVTAAAAAATTPAARFAPAARSSGRPTRSSARWVNGRRFGERFGTETMEKLGGLSTLLKFLGTVCADAEASALYADVLPFGLSADLLAVEAGDAAAAAAAAAAEKVAQRSKTRSASAGSRKSAGGKSGSGGAKAARPSSRSRPPAATSGGATAASAKPPAQPKGGGGGSNAMASTMSKLPTGGNPRKASPAPKAKK
eukprot:TRINITY_DN10930_c1_g2_i1.p1 TRINITY_DN10930_c1_g2~~TRINITY_DN10930_c1_g2_i1.p1  ORF type:complete len:379 (-),score=111.95 TRINITY_DN10930_c1_g2_i1:73-1209(-)